METTCTHVVVKDDHVTGACFPLILTAALVCVSDKLEGNSLECRVNSLPSHTTNKDPCYPSIYLNNSLIRKRLLFCESRRELTYSQVFPTILHHLLRIDISFWVNVDCSISYKPFITIVISEAYSYIRRSSQDL